MDIFNQVSKSLFVNEKHGEIKTVVAVALLPYMVTSTPQSLDFWITQ